MGTFYDPSVYEMNLNALLDDLRQDINITTVMKIIAHILHTNDERGIHKNVRAAFSAVMQYGELDELVWHMWL